MNLEDGRRAIQQARRQNKPVYYTLLAAYATGDEQFSILYAYARELGVQVYGRREYWMDRALRRYCC